MPACRFMERMGRRILRVAVQAFRHFKQHQGINQAAAIAFYCLLSIIPMYFIAVLLMGELFGDRGSALGIAADQLSGLTPWFDESLMGRIRRLTWAVPQMGWFSLLVIIWTAGLSFATIRRNLLLPWAVPRRQPGWNWWRTLRYWLVTPALCLCLMLVLTAMASLCALPELLLPSAELRAWGPWLPLWRFLWPWSFEFLLYLILLPGVRPIGLTVVVSGSLALAGWGITAVCSGVLFRLPGQALIYGSLGGTVLFLLWLNYNAALLVYGGHFIRIWRQERESVPPAAGLQA